MNQSPESLFGFLEPCLLKYNFESRPRGVRTSWFEGHAPSVIQACKDESLNLKTVIKATWSILLHAYSRVDNPCFAYVEFRDDDKTSPIMCNSALVIENDTPARQFFEDEAWQSDYVRIAEDMQAEALRFANTCLVIDLRQQGQNQEEQQWQCLLKEVSCPSPTVIIPLTDTIESIH